MSDPKEPAKESWLKLIEERIEVLRRDMDRITTDFNSGASSNKQDLDKLETQISKVDEKTDTLRNEVTTELAKVKSDMQNNHYLYIRMSRRNSAELRRLGSTIQSLADQSTKKFNRLKDLVSVVSSSLTILAVVIGAAYLISVSVYNWSQARTPVIVAPSPAPQSHP